MSQANKPSGMTDSLYLCAPVNALVEGIYEEKIPLREIKRHGDFVLGTFNHLDGEMVLLDGRVYQICGDGQVNQVSDESVLTPFAAVTFYRPLSEEKLAEEVSYESFLDWLGALLPSPNIFYAIRIEGAFSRMKARSVTRQENYRPLAEAARDQSVFEWRDIQGTLAGFYTPSFVPSVSVPGLHLHFLSNDLGRGGHLLECIPREVRAGVQMIYNLELSLPKSLDYLTWDFRRDARADLHKAER
ncbi:MAG TPA: acetolactate decarboxylase [Thermodesulfobacteriota bacterium]|nr:acetolactate decarboxylase [Thermodesulfobacteriota bacterium]